MNYGWVAVYGENDFLFQFDELGVEAAYGDIKRDELKEFHLVNKDTGQTVFAMALEPEQRLIYRKRISVSGVTGDKNWEVLMIGWQQNVNGTNVQCINWVFDDGSIIQTGKFQEDHMLFYAPELLDIEK